MNTRALIIGLILTAAIVAGGAYVLREAFLPEDPGQETATTTPRPSAEATEITVEARINEAVRALGHTIIPLQVLEDSRCPLDVQCIQAGTVRLRAQLESGMGTAIQEFTLGQKITTETAVIELTSVTPAPRAGTVIDEGDYRFMFKVMKRTPFSYDGKG